ncbi:MAG: 30S ribosome-binding factor RbfA [Alphaproteobacteria bacterium]|nr:30S ribosome-binding factor RbfA [Alphaproteobacteria bacterium]
MPKNPTRPLRIGEEIRHALSEIFLRGETHIPVLDGASITVSEVRLSPDLRNATVFIMPLAGSNQADVMQALGESGPYIRHLLAAKVALRYMPKLHYKLDQSFEEAERVNSLLKKAEVARDLK